MDLAEERKDNPKCFADLLIAEILKEQDASNPVFTR